MTGRKTLRRYVVGGRTGLGLVLQLSVLASYGAFQGACAPATRQYRPRGLRAYEIVVGSRDSLAKAIGRGLRKRGFHVRTDVRGGSGPAAYLLAFVREAEPGGPRWLHVRLADTRSGAVVAAVSAPEDSLGATPDARVGAIVDSLVSTAPRPLND